VLEKDDFANEFAVLPADIDRRTKVGKDMYAQFVENSCGKSIIQQADFEMIYDMCQSVLSNKYASQLLKGEHEQSMYFTDEFTGIQCKIRPDCYKVIGDRVIITDLKSCKSAVAEDFIRDIIKYHYDLQAYMYRLGVAKTLGVPIENVSFVFVPVEKKAPYLMGMYEVTQDIFDRGEMLFRKYIGMYKECMETNNWYGYNGFTNSPMTIGLPNWITKNEQGE
jgi:exodeoxyribonuclease VIII